VSVGDLVRRRGFRDLLVGQGVSALGDWMGTVVAFRLRQVPVRIASAVGGILTLRLLPAVIGGPLAARAVGKWDRRNTMLLMDLALAALIALVPLVRAIWWIYVLAFVIEIASIVFLPARDASIPELVDEVDLPVANGLVLGSSYGTIPLGAAAFAVVAALPHSSLFGRPFALVFWIDAATFVISYFCIRRLTMLQRHADIVHANPLRSLVDGFSFLRSKPLLVSLMLMDFFAMIVCTSRPVMPYFADRVFEVGPQGLGLLYAAPAVGSAAVALTSGWTSGVVRRGLGVLVAASLFGLASGAFGLLPRDGFVLGLFVLAFAEGADIVSAILRRTILLYETPDALRGRVSAINLVFVAGGPQLGQVEMGVVASLLSPELAIVTGGLACVGIVLVSALLVPQIARYRAEPEPAGAAAGSS